MPFLKNSRRVAAIGALATGLVCPCHVLVGLVGLVSGGALLSPAAQDGLHAVYVPAAVLTGALLLRRPAHREILHLRVMDDDGGGAVLGVQVGAQAERQTDLVRRAQ
jgi:hypothetical protein